MTRIKAEATVETASRLKIPALFDGQSMRIAASFFFDSGGGKSTVE
jgi:hypothetical protein